MSGYAMCLNAIGAPLERVARDTPVPRRGELLLEIAACGVCRTDLHVIDGEVFAHLPIVPGHEIVGRVLAIGEGVTGVSIGQRMGVPWLGGTCGHCSYCLMGRENLCDNAVFTGATRDGGYATHVSADARFCFPLPDAIDDVAAAPLLCAGLIGWRSLVLAGEGKRIGLYGFGAAAHIIAQVAIWQGRKVFAFTAPATPRDRHSPARLAASGPAGRTWRRPNPSIRRSSTLLSAGLSQRH